VNFFGVALLLSLAKSTPRTVLPFSDDKRSTFSKNNENYDRQNRVEIQSRFLDNSHSDLLHKRHLTAKSKWITPLRAAKALILPR
jgi:hypothetical protein